MWREHMESWTRCSPAKGCQSLAYYVCAHDLHEQCEWGISRPGPIFRAAREFDVDLRQSWMVGDKASGLMSISYRGRKTRTNSNRTARCEISTHIQRSVRGVPNVSTGFADVAPLAEGPDRCQPVAK